MTVTKTSSIVLTLGASGYMSKLHYTSDKPFEVALQVTDRLKRSVSWTLPRDLLRDGLTRPVDCGYINIQPSTYAPSRLLISFDDITFTTAIALVELFVKQTYDLVPAGREHEWLDLDRELAQLLGEGKKA